jgi:hypothetical protein
VQSIARNRVFFQYDPVSGSNQALGRQDAGRWTPGDPFRPDKLGNRFAVVFGHCLPPFCRQQLFAAFIFIRRRRR